MAGRSGNGKVMSCGGAAGPDGAAPLDGVRTSPTKRNPLRAMVRISFCAPPLSPTARRAALMRLVKVDSDTIRPPQTDAMRSSLLTMRSRLRRR